MKQWKGSIVKFRWMEGGTWFVVSKDGGWCEIIPMDDKAKEFTTDRLWLRTMDLVRA